MERLVSRAAGQGSLGKAAELAKIQKEKEVLEEHLERLQLLANATKVLISDELDYEKRLKDLGEVVVPAFADWCAINIVHGRPSYTLVTSASPEKRAIAEEIQRKYPPRPESTYGISDVIRQAEPRLYAALPEDLMRQTTQSEEHYQLLRQLGIVSVILAPLVARDQILGGITFVTSDSGRVYTEADLDTAAQLANSAAISLENALLHQELMEANRAKEKFLAMLAHELRNPLTPIRNSLPILAAKGDDDYEVKDIVDIMDRQIRTMSRLLDDLFDVSRITEGKIQFQMEGIDLLALVQSIIQSRRAELEKKGFKFSVYLGEGPLVIMADRVRVEQVIVNLLNNAAKYTPSGGHIALECGREGGQAVIRVRDTGKGIPPHMLKKIFQLFIQVDQSIDRPEGGLGLGLTLVQILVEHHGGTVLARSEGVGKGSEFVVSLPLAVSPLPKTADQHPNRLVQDSPRRILIVDDNEDAANSIGKLLRKFGHEVQIAYDGIAALEEAKAFAPEVVLLDLGLPILDGYETARRLRSAVPDRNKLLLIALSGYGQEEDRRRAMEAGFDHHLVKPFDTHELRALLNAWTPDRS